MNDLPAEKSVKPAVELTTEQQRLCRRIGHSFTNPALLLEALSHRSTGSRNYERLEFLGDSLLSFAIADELYRRNPTLDEGALSRLRASLVRGSSLAEIGRELVLGECLILGVGELKSGGFNRDSILADSVESLLGAAYYDAGYEAARSLVLRLFEQRIENLPPAEELKDPKTRLQEMLQARGLDRPVYKVVATSGKSHQMEFTVTGTIAAHNLSVSAQASSRRKAEQQAASALLIKMDALLSS